MRVNELVAAPPPRCPAAVAIAHTRGPGGKESGGGARGTCMIQRASEAR